MCEKNQENDLDSSQKMAYPLETQSQQSGIWSDLESQPIDHIIWGRFYAKMPKLNNYDLSLDEITVGRAENATIQVTCAHLPKAVLDRVSKIHFKITRNLNDPMSPAYLTDLSRNGTFLNGDKIGQNQKRILLTEDIIAVAHPKCKLFAFQDLAPNDLEEIPKKLLQKYYISKKLGSGAMGTVRLAYDRKSCRQYAMKSVAKNPFFDLENPKNPKNPDRVMNEVKIMSRLRHPCIIKMHDIYDQPGGLFMVLEFMEGGDLVKRISMKKRLSESITKLYFYQLCSGIQYLHKNGVTHRDIKPDNILLSNNNDETLLKISDFGLSKIIADNSQLKTVCGTMLYVAPEILMTGGKGSYTEKVDLWSLGVVLYACLSGSLPFVDDVGVPAMEKIKAGKFSMTQSCWKNVSNDARYIIQRLLTVNPLHRPSTKEILSHDWFLRDQYVLRKAKELMKISPNNYLSVKHLPQTTWSKAKINETTSKPSGPQKRTEISDGYVDSFLEPPIKRLRLDNKVVP